MHADGPGDEDRLVFLAGYPPEHAAGGGCLPLSRTLDDRCMQALGKEYGDDDRCCIVCPWHRRHPVAMQLDSMRC
jgi:hypothetical protein